MATNPKKERAERGSKANAEFARRVVREWMRCWGKYEKPFEFRIAVTELHDGQVTK